MPAGVSPRLSIVSMQVVKRSVVIPVYHPSSIIIMSFPVKERKEKFENLPFSRSTPIRYIPSMTTQDMASRSG